MNIENNFLSFISWNLIEDRIRFLSAQCESNKSEQQNSALWHKELSFLSNLIVQKDSISNVFFEIEKIENEIKSIFDLELKNLYQEELEVLQKQIVVMQNAFYDIIYQDSIDEKQSVFIEIRAGTGGQEASLFVGDLARMYTLFAQKKNLQLTVSDASYTEIGGFREIVLHVDSEQAYFWFGLESGVHRVQRVPVTENSGRVHTSTVTVAVLPEVDDVAVLIDSKDLRIDTYRAGGAGGQHVNKTDSAVRITHLPSGVVVQCQDERSQHKNKARAMKALQAKLFALEQEKLNQNISQVRKDMVSNAERAEKIRTYNYPQNRVTDHRFGVSLNQLDFLMNGSLENFFSQIQEENKKNKKFHKYVIPFVDN